MWILLQTFTINILIIYLLNVEIFMIYLKKHENNLVEWIDIIIYGIANEKRQ